MDLSINEFNTKVDYWEVRSGTWAIAKTKAVKITHLPTSITATCDVHRSVHKNKQEALRQLKTKLEVYSKMVEFLPVAFSLSEEITVDDTELANAMDVLSAYPGRYASDGRLDVWEAMRDSIVNQDKGE